MEDAFFLEMDVFLIVHTNIGAHVGDEFGFVFMFSVSLENYTL